MSTSNPLLNLLNLSSVPRLQAFAHLIRLFNQTGTLLLLFPTLWALVLASQRLAVNQFVNYFCAGLLCHAKCRGYYQ